MIAVRIGDFHAHRVRDDILILPLYLNPSGLIFCNNAGTNDNQFFKIEFRICLPMDNLFHIRTDTRNVAAASGKNDTVNFITGKGLFL